MSEVLIQEGEVATVTLNRPDRRNALTVDGSQAVADALEKLAAEARVIVLTGAGPAFCAGGDFEELARLSEADPAQAAVDLYSGYQRMVRAVREVDVPVIAAVNGPAMGAGMDLALACDLRIASTQAKFGQVWVKLGIIPGTGGAFWTGMLAGWARAAELILTGKVIDAATALEWGLVNEVAEPADLIGRAKQVASSIAENPPAAVAANKRALNETIRASYEAALAHAREVQPLLFSGDEFKQAIEARKKS